MKTTKNSRRRNTLPMGSIAPVVAFVVVVYSVVNAVDRDLIPAQTRIIEGSVVDVTGPVNCCVVRVKGREQSSTTNAHGHFALPCDHTDSVRVVASKAGYYIAGADYDIGKPLKIQLTKHEVVDHPEYEWQAPQPDLEKPAQCGNCHLEIYQEWSHSAHATSASNPKFKNVYDGTDALGNENIGWNLLADYPDGAGVCAACHVPSLEPSLDGIKHLATIDGVHALGTHCDLCHKVADVSLENIGLSHGRSAMRFIRPSPGEQIFFGPLDDVDRGEDVYSSLYETSEYCASCHEGTLFGTHAYSTYTEWTKSPQAAAGVQCQDCHMAPTGKMTNFAPDAGGIERSPNTLASHSFPGSDRKYLSDHLSLKLQAEAGEAGFAVTAIVQPKGIGHRVPTGHPSRSLLLWIEARSLSGKRLDLISGPTLPDLAGQGTPETGGLAGRPGQLYGKVFENFDGQQAVPYWQPTRLAYDSRLYPETAVKEQFVFRHSPDTVEITAKLIYRSFSKQVADEKQWQGNDLTVAEVSTLLDASSR